MQISAREILGLPVFGRSDEKRLGRVLDLVVLPENGKIVALFVSAGFWGRARLVSTRDILEIAENKIFIHSAREMVEVEEIVSAKKVIFDKIKILGSAVYTESGERVGSVSDFWFDHEGWFLTKIQVSPGFFSFSPKLLVGWRDIVEIKPGKIIISSDVVLNKIAEGAKG